MAMWYAKYHMRGRRETRINQAPEPNDQGMIMSTTTTHFQQELGLYEGAKAALRRWRPFTHLRDLWEALGEGLAASRRYQQLTARGMPHEEAASRVFFEHYQR